jgi:hypothetical protein
MVCIFREKKGRGKTCLKIEAVSVLIAEQFVPKVVTISQFW